MEVTATDFLDRRRRRGSSILPLIQVIRRRGNEADEEKRGAEHDEGILTTESQFGDILERSELCQSHSTDYPLIKVSKGKLEEEEED